MADTTTSSRWYDLAAHWRDAGWSMRARTVLFPLLVPLALLLDPMLGVMLAAAVIMVCAVALSLRVLLQPLRAGEPTRLLAWRLPFALVLAGSSFHLATSSYEHARFQARDLIVEMQDRIGDPSIADAWACGDVDRCTVELGHRLVPYPAYVSRLDAGDYEVLLYLGPDVSTRFTASAAGVQAYGSPDFGEPELDLATLQPAQTL